MEYADVVSNMEAAVTALSAGDYGTARNKALAAQALASILPDTTRNSSGGGNQGLTWDRVAISTFLNHTTRLLNSSVGVQSSKGVGQPLSGQGVTQLGVF